VSLYRYAYVYPAGSFSNADDALGLDDALALADVAGLGIGDVVVCAADVGAAAEVTVLTLGAVGDALHAPIASARVTTARLFRMAVILACPRLPPLQNRGNREQIVTGSSIRVMPHGTMVAMRTYTATVPVDEQWISITKGLKEPAPWSEVEPAIQLRSSADWGQKVGLELQVYEQEEIPTVPSGAWQRDLMNTVTVDGELHVLSGTGRQAELPQVPAGDYAVTTWVMGRSENAEAVAAWEKHLPTGDAGEVSAPDCSERWIVQLQRRDQPRSLSYDS